MGLNERTKVDVIQLIGTLDRCISELLLVANHKDAYHEADVQTIKHHAEDMISGGQAALKRLGVKAPADPKETRDLDALKGKLEKTLLELDAAEEAYDRLQEEFDQYRLEHEDK